MFLSPPLFPLIFSFLIISELCIFYLINFFFQIFSLKRKKKLLYAYLRHFVSGKITNWYSRLCRPIYFSKLYIRMTMMNEPCYVMYCCWRYSTSLLRFYWILNLSSKLHFSFKRFEGFRFIYFCFCFILSSSEKKLFSFLPKFKDPQPIFAIVLFQIVKGSFMI